MPQIRIIFISVFMTFALSLHAQTFGVRAGLNQSTITGAKLPGESLGFSGGFHFGISYSYNVTDIFSIRAEISYLQNGGSYNYDSTGYYIVRDDDGDTFEKGKSTIILDKSNGYLGLPITANFQLNNKWEVYGGIYANLLVSPVARGTHRFESSTRPDDFTSVSYTHLTLPTTSRV